MKYIYELIFSVTNGISNCQKAHSGLLTLFVMSNVFFNSKQHEIEIKRFI